MKKTTVKALMMLFCLPSSCFAFVGQQQGNCSEGRDWHFVTSEGSFTTNALEDCLSSVVCKVGMESDVEFRSSDKVCKELIRGRIRRFGSYARVYSALYAEIVMNSTMPKDLLLSSVEMNVSGELGDVCVKGKRWSVESSKFLTTKKPKFVYYATGTFLVNVCGNENEVMKTAMRINDCLSSIADNRSKEEMTAERLSVLEAKCRVQGSAKKANGRFCLDALQVFGDDGRITAAAAWLSLALLDNHPISGREGRRRSDVALRLLNESRCFSPLLSNDSAGGVVDALNRTIEIELRQTSQSH